MKMKTLLRYWLILNKRLLKKPGFVIILALIPLLVGAMGIVSGGQSSGMVTVALVAQNNEDPLAQELIRKLTDSSRLVHFVVCDSQEAACGQVEAGQADAAWIFADDLQKKMDAFTQHIHPRNAFVVIIQREDTVLLRLSHEKLNGALYPYLSQSLYQNYMYDHIISTDQLTPQQLKDYYDAVGAEGSDLFDFVYPDSDTPVDTDDANYLMSPLRGLMVILMTLGGLAVAMFYMQDEMRGTFDRLPSGKRFALSVVYQTTAVVGLAVVVLLALAVTGMMTAPWRELAAMAMFCALTVGFCMAVRLLCGDLRLLGAVVPLLAVGMILLCPVFFKVSAPVAQYLLPPYYYLNAVYDNQFLGYMAVYAVLLYGLDYLLFKLRSAA